MEFQDDSETIEAVAFNDVASKFHNELVLGDITPLKPLQLNWKISRSSLYTQESNCLQPIHHHYENFTGKRTGFSEERNNVSQTGRTERKRRESTSQ